MKYQSTMKAVQMEFEKYKVGLNDMITDRGVRVHCELKDHCIEYV